MSWETLAWARKATTGSPGRKAVLMVLAEHADEADSCYPSQQLIADDTEQSVRTVRSHLEALEAAQLIRREHRGNTAGGRTSDRYFLLTPAANLAGKGEGVTGKIGGVTGNVLPPNSQLEPPTDEPLLRVADQPPPDLFDAFYRAYPRRQGPGAARRAWGNAIKKADPASILAAAERYRADPNLPPTEFIPYPQRWLNDERWNDGPLPARAKPGRVRTPESVDTDRDGPEGRVAL